MSQVPPESQGSYSDAFPELADLVDSEEFVRQKSSAREHQLLTNPDPKSVAWRLALADVLAEVGDLKKASSEAHRAVEIAPDDDSLSDALRALLAIVIELGDTVQAEEIGVRLHAVAYGSREMRPMANFAEGQGNLRLRTGDLISGRFYESESRFRSAVRAWHRLGDDEGCLRAYHGLADALAATGMYAEAIEQTELGLDLCRHKKLWRFVPTLFMNRAFALRDVGLHEPARESFLQAIRWSEQCEDTPSLVRSLLGYMVLIGYQVTATDQSSLPKFREIYRRAEALAIEARLHPRLIEIYQRAAELYEKIGMWDRAVENTTLWQKVADQETGSTLEYYKESHERERHELESQRLERFRVRLQETIESTSDALLIFDSVRSADGQLVDFVCEFRNHAADVLCSSVPTDVLTLSQMAGQPVFTGLAEIIRESMGEGKPYEDEIYVESTGRWMGRRIVQVGDGVAITCRDLTIEHDARDALQRAAESARQSDRAKSVFLSNMSHEVRTPINGVLGLAHLLTETELLPEQRRYVEGIVSSADILLGVLGDVLDLSKIEAGRVELNLEPTDLRSLVSRVVGLFAGQAAEAGVQLTSEVDEEVPAMVRVDPTRLRQVLANLIGNAVKFTKAGQIHVSAKPIPSGIRFEVSDTGEGISSDKLASIFDAFRQGDVTVGAANGTGLGLTISRKLVEMMGGAINVHSSRGEGSHFEVDLPLAPVDEEVVARETRPANLAGLRVLLVEDNPVNTMVATGLLNSAGCVVQSVTEGAEAVEMAADVPFDVILMDVRMPGMDGLEATRRIRAAEASYGRHTPIIAVTASAFTDDREECFQAGMDDYLGKPFTAEGLRLMLGRWAGRL